MVFEIGKEIHIMKKVGLPRDQFRRVAVIRYFQEMRQSQRFHSALSSMDFQHVSEHDSVQRHALHSPNVH